jgi:hypothetical protein
VGCFGLRCWPCKESYQRLPVVGYTEDPDLL